MIENIIITKILNAVEKLFSEKIDPKILAIQRTAPIFRNEGDFSIVVFQLLKISKKTPEETAKLIGDELLKTTDIISDYSVAKGYLNIKLKESYWIEFVCKNYDNANYGNKQIIDSKPIVIEYSSPNTNKPLHLGHIRNNLLGFSVSKILKANGKNVKMVNLINDRGIHICKSMLAWKLKGDGKTPEDVEIKGDKFVGNYYVIFDRLNKNQIIELNEKGVNLDDIENKTPLMDQAREMLVKWENNDVEVRSLWQKMNSWVYAGFDETYKRLGIYFDKIYYESQTYLLGKDIVNEGLKNNVFYKKEDNSVWVDLTNDGLDEKLLLRSDGTSVYMTQDIGTAIQRVADFSTENLIYIVGNEQNYHFEVLKLILKKLGYNWADSIFHLSYGMVELPHGKMKSREGTVVDADDIMDEMIETARNMTEELGKIDDFNNTEAIELYNTIGLGALKYFMLKVDPKKNFMFNPKESIDFNGNTAPFIQYTHARIKSILRKVNNIDTSQAYLLQKIDSIELSLIILLYQYSNTIENAAKELNPAIIANYLYDLAKQFNQFYHELSILNEKEQNKKMLRIAIANMTSMIIRNGMNLLGINVPERM